MMHLTNTTEAIVCYLTLASAAYVSIDIMKLKFNGNAYGSDGSDENTKDENCVKRRNELYEEYDDDGDRRT